MSQALFGLFFVFLAAGMPIFVVLGLTAAVLLAADGSSLLLLAQKVLDELNSELLMALPFFGMAAVFMQRGGIAGALIDVSAAWMGRLPGGLGVVAVAGCTIFAAIAGSSVATALAMGTILVPAMVARGYPASFSTALIGTGGTLGILIPPSLPLILFAIIAEQSVPRLFLAGVVPGVLQALLLIAFVIWTARRKGYPPEPPMSRAGFIRVNLRALPAFSVPAIVAVGIYGGFVTVTEAAVLAALVAMLVGMLVYRGFTLRQAPGVMGQAVRSAASIMVIIAMALAFGHWVTESGVPAAVVDFVTANELEPWQFLLAINLLLLILGMFLEVASIILIAVPILLPVVTALGIDPIHFAIVIVVNMEIALLTPPVGLNLYVLSSISKVPVSEVIRGVWPFIGLFAVYLALITYIPELSLWLPNLVYGN
ncbi:TRAP transporter large permease [Tistrella bauzanensis]|uniref:TRAP transporter large permease n=1 Tax=Tistrella TaxID=171436 RepID=UPI0031F65E01